MKRTDADACVLARVADGDTAALAELYERYGEPLFAFLFRLAGDRGTAEEILQDTMLAVWRSAGTFQRRSSASTWLFGVARRQAHNRLRLATPRRPRSCASSVTRCQGRKNWRSAATGCTRCWLGCRRRSGRWPCFISWWIWRIRTRRGAANPRRHGEEPAAPGPAETQGVPEWTVRQRGARRRRSG
ncbi:RNA polymerase sigma factor [Nonomuraea cavernae]|nr:RNA polymerase sigma factor [Nonomuraea cavernae]